MDESGVNFVIVLNEFCFPFQWVGVTSLPNQQPEPGLPNCWAAAPKSWQGLCSVGPSGLLLQEPGWWQFVFSNVHRQCNLLVMIFFHNINQSMFCLLRIKADLPFQNTFSDGSRSRTGDFRQRGSGRPGHWSLHRVLQLHGGPHQQVPNPSNFFCQFLFETIFHSRCMDPLSIQLSYIGASLPRIPAG